MRRWLAAAAALLALAAPAATSAAPKPAPPSAVQSLLVQLNGIRRAHGLVPFKVSSALTVAAQAHAASMGNQGYFSHDFSGVPFGSWIGRYYPHAAWAGENILWGSRPLSVATAVSQWMNSPGHRENILRPTFREIGLGVVNVERAPGVYNGLSVTIAVTDFGAR
jgi:uncharacterized protein YkwD